MNFVYGDPWELFDLIAYAKVGKCVKSLISETDIK